MYFVITKDGDGYRARIYASNGQLVWWTEGYTTQAAAVNAIRIVKSGAPTASIYDRT